MTASKELESLFRDARQQVDSWATWQRSVDPHGAVNTSVCESRTPSEENPEAAKVNDDKA